MEKWLKEPLTCGEVELADNYIQEMHPLRSMPIISLFSSLSFLAPYTVKYQAY
jgi:hypothetical protein